MYIFASLLFVLCLVICTVAAGMLLTRRMIPAFSGFAAWSEPFSRYAFFSITASLTICSVILFYAFAVCDFRVEYVASYSSRALPLFYRVTAFWAGQHGSLLFWAWTVAIGGVFFIASRSYKGLSQATCDWFWCFFFAVMAFFFYILLTSSNPFTLIPASFVPDDGRGLNPLLQNPGMIFHPPLLFLGYGGFTIPACLALAQAMSGTADTHFSAEQHWAKSSRPFIITAWALLTAGIILGAWWAYMELGWGGYWAWDPVENASLIPWLVASAYLHTAIIERNRDKLTRVNIFLMALVTISAFFATYLVRSGVIQSLHAFGSGGIGLPFLLFTGTALVLAFMVAFSVPKKTGELEDLFSREGLLLIVCWVLLLLAGIILVATMWPVIITGITAAAKVLPAGAQTFLNAVPTGLTEVFYNRVCLPLFALLALVLLFCPHVRWSGGFTRKAAVYSALAGTVAFAILLWFTGIRIPLATFAAAVAIGAIAGLIMFFASNKALLKSFPAIAAHGTHLGLLLVVLGVAFSGPYSVKTENVVLEKNRSVQIGSYVFTLEEIWTGESAPNAQGQSNYVFYEAAVRVTQTDGKNLGLISPQLRRYHTHPDSLYPEIDTIPGLGNELYASLMGVDDKTPAVNLTIYINPLVNWLWIGGVLMSVLPLFALFGKKKRQCAQGV